MRVGKVGGSSIPWDTKAVEKFRSWSGMVHVARCSCCWVPFWFALAMAPIVDVAWVLLAVWMSCWAVRWEIFLAVIMMLDVLMFVDVCSSSCFRAWIGLNE